MTFQEIVKYVVDNGKVCLSWSSDGFTIVNFEIYKDKDHLEVCSIYLPEADLLDAYIKFSDRYNFGLNCKFFDIDGIEEDEYFNAVELTELINESGFLND